MRGASFYVPAALGAAGCVWDAIAAPTVIPVNVNGMQIGTITIDTTPSGLSISGTFSCNAPMFPSLSAAATKAGEDHFNWYQIVDGDNRPPMGSGGTLSVPYVDPPPGGYYTGTNANQWADCLPWYYDEQLAPNGSNTTGFSPGFNIANNTTSTSLDFFDSPREPGATNNLSFKTWLVSLNADGSFHAFEGGFSWGWSTGTNSSASGTGTVSGIMPLAANPTAEQYNGLIGGFNAAWTNRTVTFNGTNGAGGPRRWTNDTNTTNFLFQGSPIPFNTFYHTIFDNTGLGTVLVDPAGVTAGSIFINNTTGAYTFVGGPITAQNFNLNASGVNLQNNAVFLENLSATSGGNIFLGNATQPTAMTIYGTMNVGGALLINPRSSVTLVPGSSNGATGRLTQRLGTLFLNGTGTTIGSLDIGNHELLLGNANPNAIKGYVAAAFDANGDPWSKPGLTSSLARANPTKYSVAYAYGGDQSAQDAGITLHDGLTPLGLNQTLVRAVLTGDANLDGTVNFFDVTQILGYKYNTGQPASYTDGDLNYDGVVDFFDLINLLSANYNTGENFDPALASGPVTAPSVPEPAGWPLIGLGAAGFLPRRRRRRSGSG
jgi:hypothetical protein